MPVFFTFKDVFPTLHGLSASQLKKQLEESWLRGEA